MANHTTKYFKITELVKATLYVTLYVTFYNEQDKKKKEDKLKKLVACLSSPLNPLGTAEFDCESWCNQDQTRFLYHFPAFAAEDTTIIQLILNHDGLVTTAWDNMYKELKNLLENSELKKEENVGSSGHEMFKDLTLGYTLIYQARLKQKDGIDLSRISREDLKDLLPPIRSLSSRQNQTLQPLAYSHISDNTLWLMAIPTQGEGFDAEMVYLTLSPSEKEADYMKNNVLVGPVATWLMPDLIAHKSYHEMRQYRLKNIPNEYKDQLKDMRESAGKMLQDVNPKALGLTGAVTPEMKRLPKQYGFVIGTDLPIFNELRVSLEKQLYNYQQLWEKKNDANSSEGVRTVLSKVGSDNILEYHQVQIETGVFELQAMAHEGENAIKAVQAAVDAVRTETELKRERQQETFNMLLTVVGLGLATANIVNLRAAEILLELELMQNIIQFFGFTATSTDPLHQLITQIVVTIAVVAVGSIIGWLFIKRKIKILVAIVVIGFLVSWLFIKRT